MQDLLPASPQELGNFTLLPTAQALVTLLPGLVFCMLDGRPTIHHVPLVLHPKHIAPSPPGSAMLPECCTYAAAAPTAAEPPEHQEVGVLFAVGGSGRGSTLGWSWCRNPPCCSWMSPPQAWMQQQLQTSSRLSKGTTHFSLSSCSSPACLPSLADTVDSYMMSSRRHSTWHSMLLLLLLR